MHLSSVSSQESLTTWTRVVYVLTSLDAKRNQTAPAEASKIVFESLKRYILPIKKYYT